MFRFKQVMDLHPEVRGLVQEIGALPSNSDAIKRVDRLDEALRQCPHCATLHPSFHCFMLDVKLIATAVYFKKDHQRRRHVLWISLKQLGFLLLKIPLACRPSKTPPPLAVTPEACSSTWCSIPTSRFVSSCPRRATANDTWSRCSSRASKLPWPVGSASSAAVRATDEPPRDSTAIQQVDVHGTDSCGAEGPAVRIARPHRVRESSG